MRKILYSVTALLFAAVSCSRSGEWKRLCDVETYIEARPDSALAALQNVDTLSLRGRQERAKYALLYTMALDKNFIDTTDMGMIRPAVTYYRRHGTAEDRAKALYYQGRIYDNAGEYNQAIVSFTEALPLLAKVEDRKFHGQLYAAMSGVYQQAYDVGEALSYARKEYEIYSEVQDRKDYYLALNNYAVASSNAGYVGRADSIYNVLLDAKDVQEKLLNDVRSNYGIQQAVADSTDRALELFRAAISSSGSLPSYGAVAAYAYAVARSEDVGSGRAIIETILEAAPYEYYFWRYRIDESAGDYRSAYDNLKRMETYKDTAVNEYLRHSTIKSQRDYFEERSKALSAESKITKLWIAIAVLVTIIVAGVSGVMTVRLLRRKKMEEARLKILIMEMETQLQESEQAYLEEKSAMSDDFEKEKAAIRSSFMSRHQMAFDKLRSVSEILMRSGKAEPKSYHEIFEELKKTIILYSDKEGQTQFEQDLDLAMDNIMTCFRNDLPGLPEDDYRLFGYLCAGFDYGLAMILMKCQSPGSFYARKHRLSKKVSSLPSSCEKKSKYLVFLE